ncbi:GNAT family N-acetyltransferase [Streptomyces sp. RY43-2]|uniref:GNAT family N-acetyltransferase n=1 Tax=Streptomyces macrolidinus TaxID=2952607 RepID=A0ABT0ZIB7_9ACTN|nr:GNAT family N-acetyltransferase [Streptomyces macrolidinus]MCN9243329.1 GNAT family N-acetyltransferase [Streptomyces macrolidinus]
MRIMGGEQVKEAVAGCAAVLRTAADRDWGEVRAGRLTWSCRFTAGHITSDLVTYAAQLAGRAQDVYLPFDITLDEEADNEEAVQGIELTGALFAAALDTAPRGVRAFHPWPFRSADREGFAAMGIAEVLLHTHDIAEGLGLAYEPSAELCEGVLTRIFPQVRPGPDHWRTLLWATGRGDLPGRAPVTDWRWHNNVVIPGARLTLEGLTPARAIDLAQGGTGGFDWLDGGPFEGTRDAAGMLVKAYEAGQYRPEWGVFALVRAEDGLAVGAMGFHSAPDADGTVELGYDLVEGARGHGYATEALRSLADRTLARDDVSTLTAVIDRPNLPSQGVVTRAGFDRVAEDEKTYTYALTR